MRSKGGSGTWRTSTLGIYWTLAVAIDILLSFNFAVVFSFHLFLFPASKAKILVDFSIIR
jgi:hypothetical protein